MGPRKPSPTEDPKSATGHDADYLSKRARNNEAVKRSREKARLRSKETSDRVGKLKAENEMLEERIKLLSKELTFLKDIFLAHAGSAHGLCVDDLDIKALLREDDDEGNSEEKVQNL
jgi:CCAAT/enhancer binding protein (C/EBP) gamma